MTLFANHAMAQVGNSEVLADPNLAEMDALMSMPHMTGELAQAVIDGRPYLTAGQLDKVLASGMDESQRDAVYGQLFRQINLNTASEADIMLIPGMSSRMTHEFEEYRPYTSLDQFRREIGKYVDDDEVARLEQYVFVPMNLNTASEESFETIPGMTPKMVHEFEEYRPYTSMESPNPIQLISRAASRASLLGRSHWLPFTATEIGYSRGRPQFDKPRSHFFSSTTKQL